MMRPKMSAPKVPQEEKSISQEILDLLSNVEPRATPMPARTDPAPELADDIPLLRGVAPDVPLSPRVAEEDQSPR